MKEKLTDPERMVWAAAFVASRSAHNGQRPTQALDSASRAVSACRTALKEPVLEDDLIDQRLRAMFND